MGSKALLKAKMHNARFVPLKKVDMRCSFDLGFYVMAPLQSNFVPRSSKRVLSLVLIVIG